MIPKEVYWQRRKELKSMAGEGLLLLAGNAESAMNYRGNTYHFRQDSSFLYFFGVAGVCLRGYFEIMLTAAKIGDKIGQNQASASHVVWMA